MFRPVSKFLLVGLLVILTVALFGQNNWDQQRQMQQQQLALQRQRAEQQRQMQQQREQQRQQMLAQQRQQREAMRQQQLQQQRAQQEAMRQQQRAQQEQIRQQQRLQQQQLRMQQQQTRQQQMADRQRQIQQNRNDAAAQQQQQRRNIAADLIRSRNVPPSASRQTAQQAVAARQQQIQQSKTTQAAIERARQLTLNRQSAAIQQQRVQAQTRQNLTQQETRRVQAKALADRARLIATQRALLSGNEVKQAQTRQITQSRAIAALAAKKGSAGTSTRAPISANTRKAISDSSAKYPIFQKQLVGPRLPETVAANFEGGKYTNRRATGDEVFYKYHGVDNRTGKDYNYITTKRYASEREFRDGVAVLKEWNIKVDRVTTFKPAKGTWVSEGVAAKQVGEQGETRPGGDYQAVIDTHNMPDSSVVRTDSLKWNDQ